MKVSQIASRCIQAGVFIYLVFQIFYLYYCLLPSAEEKTWEGLVYLCIAQSVLFAAAIFCSFLVSFLEYRKKKLSSPFKALYVISGDGKIKNQVLLKGRNSLMVTGKKDGKEVFVENTGETKEGRYIYGICKLVAGHWYFEVSPGSRPVGIRKGGEGIIYRLKENIPYPLSVQDIIYVDTCKITIKEQKYLEEPEWV